jgi:hypothetical protein
MRVLMEALVAGKEGGEILFDGGASWLASGQRMMNVRGTGLSPGSLINTHDLAMTPNRFFCNQRFTSSSSLSSFSSTCPPNTLHRCVYHIKHVPSRTAIHVSLTRRL